MNQLFFCFKIYTGSYQAPASRCIRMDDNYPEPFKPEVLVAVYVSTIKKPSNWQADRGP